MTKCSFAKVNRATSDKSPLIVLADRHWFQLPLLRDLDRRCKGAISQQAKRRRFRGAADQEVSVQTHGAVAPQSVVLIGCEANAAVAQLLGVADRIAAIAAREEVRRVNVVLPDEFPSRSLRTVAEGVALARYRFTAYQSVISAQLPLAVVFAADAPRAAQRDALASAQVRADAVCLARDLVNTPAGELPPYKLGEHAAELADGALTVEVHDADDLAELRMGAILGVGRGSRNPPCLIEMHYEPAAAPPRHLALVGKGITFDSGGLSLKPANAMELMKRDMAGGAAVIATMQAIAQLALPVRVRAYVPAAENMPDGDAIRPGDVLRVCNGKTVEVLNTDAEGRLVLADALSRAVAAEPAAIVDFATLTGAVRIALGRRCAAVMGNQQEFVDRCLRAADAAGEGLWQLPLIEDYRADIRSQVADIKNTGGEGAGTIVAGLFLREFVGRTPWAHIDFSSTVMSDGYPCHPAGPSGYGVRTALELLDDPDLFA